MNSAIKLYYHCFECVDEEFGSVDQLEVHIAKEHYNFYPFKCENCNIKFSTKWEVKRHSTRFHKTDDFICNHDKLTFKTLEIESEIKELLEKSINSSKTSNTSSISGTTLNSDVKSLHKDVEKFSKKRGLIETMSEKLEDETKMDQRIKIENDDVDKINVIESLIDTVQNNNGRISIIIENNNNSDVKIENIQSNKENQSITSDSKVGTEPTSTSKSNDDSGIFIKNSDDSRNGKRQMNISRFIQKSIDELKNKNNVNEKLIIVSPSQQTVTCPACYKEISDRKWNVHLHVCHKHVKAKMFKCKICGYRQKSFIKTKAAYHARIHKASFEECMIDYRKKNMPLVYKKTVELFGETMKTHFNF